MKHLKKFNECENRNLLEGFNDRGVELCLPLGITESLFATLYNEKIGRVATVEELKNAIAKYYEHFRRVLEENGIDAEILLNNFLKFESKNIMPIYSELKELIDKVWDGDVMYDEAVEDFSDDELKMMNDCIKKNPSIFAEGVPFPGDDEIFDEMLKNDKGTQLIQKMINNLD